jgi:diguanylate cyclase (GGDEF)-like protein
MRESFFGFAGGMFVYHANEKEDIIYADLGVLKLFACETEEEFMEYVGGTFPGMIYEEDRMAVEADIEKQQFGTESDTNLDHLDYVQYRIKDRNGKIFRVEDFGRLIQDPVEGPVYYVLLLNLDDLIFDRLYQEREKRIHVRKDEMWFVEPLLDDSLNILSEYFKKILRVNLFTGKFRPIRIVKSEWEDWPVKSDDFMQWMKWMVKTEEIHPDDAAGFLEFVSMDSMRKAMKPWKSGDVVSYRYRRRMGGNYYYVDLELLPSVNYTETEPEVLVLVHDIDAKVRLDEAEKESLEKEGLHDEMTMLKNRRAYEKDRTEAVNSGKSVAIVFVDVNGLKFINDRQGHEAGDYHLMRMAALLMEFFRPEDCYRTGGDEFIVMITGAPKESIDARVEDYRNALKADSMPGASIGYAYSDSVEKFDETYRTAEARMYEDKEAFYTRFPMARR